MPSAELWLVKQISCRCIIKFSPMFDKWVFLLVYGFIPFMSFMLSSWLLFLKMDKVFALSLKEFILWIRSEKKKEKSPLLTRCTPRPCPCKAAHSLAGGDSCEGTARWSRLPASSCSVASSTKRKHQGHSASWLQVAQAHHTGILLLPGQAGHERVETSHLQRGSFARSPTPVALEKEEPPRPLGLGNVFFWNRMLPTHQSPGLPG